MIKYSKKNLVQSFIDLGILFTLIVIISATFSKSNYYLEILISFLPQISILMFFILLVYFIFLWIHKAITVLQYLNAFLTLIMFIIAITSIYNVNFKKQEKFQTSDNIRVATFNKLWNNDNYNEINKKIRDLNPDLIGLQEIEQSEIDKMEFLESYKYSYFSDCKCKYAGMEIALFSKYELTEVQFTNTDGGPLLKAKVLLKNKEVVIYVIHPIAPLNPRYLNLRNQTLEILSRQIEKSSNPVIIIGDFNTSLWSNSYNGFINSNSLKDASFGYGIGYTWGNFPFASTIDHILISNDFSVQNFMVDENLGSDHRLIWADIGI